MEPIAVRSARRHGRRARKAPVEVQPLEARQLLTWTALGYSLPDLSVNGYAAPVAAYGEPIAVTVEVSNLGASSITEPFALAQGATSRADAPPFNVGVYMSRFPHLGPTAVRIGSVNVSNGLRQNSLAEITQTITMPERFGRLPGEGGTVYLYFRADADRVTRDYDRTNNTTRVGVPVQIVAPLPDLQAQAIDVPADLQPGAALAPAIKIANYGATDPNTQVDAVEVAVVASTDPFFGPGDVILQTFTLDSIPPLSLVPSRDTVLGDVTVEQPANVRTVLVDPFLLPGTPASYFLGVVVDPQNQVREISEIGRGPNPALEAVRQVGPRMPGLPPADPISDFPADPANRFPTPPFGRLPTVRGDLAAPPVVVESTPGTPSGVVTLAALAGPLDNQQGGPMTRPRTLSGLRDALRALRS